MTKFDEIRNKYPEIPPAFSNNWGKPSLIELNRIENDFHVKYPKEFEDFQLSECYRTPIGDIAFDGFGWASPNIDPYMNLYEIVKDSKQIGVPDNLSAFKEDNGDYYCFTDGGRIVIWDHNSNSIESNKDYQWESFCDWLLASLSK